MNRREMMRNNVKEFEGQGYTLVGLLGMGERAQVKVLSAFFRDTGLL